MYYIILMYYIFIQYIWLFLVVRYDYSMDESVVDHFYNEIAVQYEIPFQMDFYKYLKSNGKLALQWDCGSVQNSNSNGLL